MDAIGRLAGGIAHDFNNILTGIIGNISLALRRIEPDHNARGPLITAKDAGSRGANLVGQLLSFSKRRIVETKATRLDTVLNNVREMLGLLLETNIDFVANVEEHLHHVEANPAQMEQVLVNLVVNAKESLPTTGGRIGIDILNTRISEDEAGSTVRLPHGDYVELRVEDNGSGMSKDTRAKIFEPFFTTKTETGGTGLGLSTVWGIVQQHGGTVYVDSTPGQGTKIRVLLPRSQRADTSSTPASAFEPDLVGGSEHLLIVEDDPVIAELNSMVLDDAGYSVSQASNGIEALSIVEELLNKIDMVITDMQLPDMEGTALSARISEMVPHIRFLYTSGFTQTANASSLLKEGYNYLPKPYAAENLLGIVRSLLDSETK